MTTSKNKTIIVASTNPTKVKATLLGFQRMFSFQDFEAKGINVDSAVSDQPMSEKETFEGALKNF